jgi:GAF domain-containing protein
LIGNSGDIGDFYLELNRLFLKLAGIRFVWLGLLSPDGVTVVPVVESGDGGKYLAQSSFRADDSAFGRGPTGRAIQTGEPSFMNDVERDKNFKPWRERALQAGFASSGAVPIRINGKTAGALNLYSSEKNYFDAPRQIFFGEVALLLAEGFRKFRESEK